MEKALYYETYPLGITALSKVATFTALLVGALGTFLIHWAFGLGYLISYFLLMAYQIKYRKFRCQYYGKTIHSRFGKILEKMPPELDEETLKESTSDLIILSIFAYIVILAPIIGAIARMIQIVQNAEEAEGLIAAGVLVAIYCFSIIYPSFILKKEVFPAFCVDDSEAE